VVRFTPAVPDRVEEKFLIRVCSTHSSIPFFLSLYQSVILGNTRSRGHQVGNNDPEDITVAATGIYPRLRVGLTRIPDEGPLNPIESSS
jgi:hypothetical protein